MQNFDKVESIVEYRYRIDNWLLCHLKNIRMTLQSFIARFRMFNIDEKDVRNVISFEFLNLFQNVVESTCKIQKLFDLTFETNFDMISSNWQNYKLMRIKNFIMLELFLRRWNVNQCKQNFDIFIKQIFKSLNKKNFESFRHLRRIFKCWFFDDYYDVKFLENIFKLIFDSSIKMFDFHDSNNTKIVVTIITIFDALSYVIFNYNDKTKRSSDSDAQSHNFFEKRWLIHTKYQHFRSIDVNDETFVWKT